MATYNKATYTSKVTTLDGYEATFTDGKDAFEEFKAKKTIKGVVGESKVIIPFHAVKKFEKTMGTSEETKADAYCK